MGCTTSACNGLRIDPVRETGSIYDKTLIILCCADDGRVLPTNRFCESFQLSREARNSHSLREVLRSRRVDGCNIMFVGRFMSIDEFRREVNATAAAAER